MWALAIKCHPRCKLAKLLAAKKFTGATERAYEAASEADAAAAAAAATAGAAATTAAAAAAAGGAAEGAAAAAAAAGKGSDAEQDSALASSFRRASFLQTAREAEFAIWRCVSGASSSMGPESFELVMLGAAPETDEDGRAWAKLVSTKEESPHSYFQINEQLVRPLVRLQEAPCLGDTLLARYSGTDEDDPVLHQVTVRCNESSGLYVEFSDLIYSAEPDESSMTSKLTFERGDVEYFALVEPLSDG